ncbi:hypothetical protein EV426DRAFT_580299 [Tirmania nivea]|nr:hypothetical protein EV426DRAFT_580299 [Tirmania nivea]
MLLSRSPGGVRFHIRLNTIVLTTRHGHNQGSKANSSFPSSNAIESNRWSATPISSTDMYSYRTYGDERYRYEPHAVPDKCRQVSASCTSRKRDTGRETCVGSSPRSLRLHLAPHRQRPLQLLDVHHRKVGHPVCPHCGCPKEDGHRHLRLPPTPPTTKGAHRGSSILGATGLTYVGKEEEEEDEYVVEAFFTYLYRPLAGQT